MKSVHKGVLGVKVWWYDWVQEQVLQHVLINVRKKDAQETLLTLLSGPKNVLWQTQERVEELGVSLHHTLGLLGEGSLHTGREIVQ